MKMKLKKCSRKTFVWLIISLVLLDIGLSYSVKNSAGKNDEALAASIALKNSTTTDILGITGTTSPSSILLSTTTSKISDKDILDVKNNIKNINQESLDILQNINSSTD